MYVDYLMPTRTHDEDRLRLAAEENSRRRRHKDVNVLNAHSNVVAAAISSRCCYCCYQTSAPFIHLLATQPQVYGATKFLSERPFHRSKQVGAEVVRLR